MNMPRLFQIPNIWPIFIFKFSNNWCSATCIWIACPSTDDINTILRMSRCIETYTEYIENVKFKFLEFTCLQN